MSAKQTWREVVFALAIALLWSLEGRFLFFDDLFKGKSYFLWSAVFCGTHPVLFGKAIEATDVKRIKTIFSIILFLNVLASGIAAFFFIRCGKSYYTAVSFLKMLTLRSFYYFLTNNNSEQ